ncbi:molecular chaperone DnaJ [Enterobacteriaceae bacterium ET-AT1-13]|nr:molecular chaperone DnaJ [Enterobacteriaceae bacterium ET-AT1-13]WGS66494.1 molecular chaperone DnaJ [Enterobacteriaceae bacterium Cmel17]WMC17518.1 MAG: molecular chaperone DnaJ [Enterobacteriaceae bacterium Cmel21]WMC17725.1 MAG: molecular chaperone DnaJ [Enterobacteriaceae bacterium PSmelAO3-2]WMC17929.1 MAG: molecular chaperone DnaJ [Enterobacteriaceae bacterium PSmelAO3-1]WMC18132.1 MAG: molecular chaperone DnaJ [Enterobacteriaceae bacterium PSmelAO1]
MSKKDFYELLGISKTSTIQEIKKAYKRLAIKYHPDRNKQKNAEKKFKEIKEAYEILSDEKKRSAYDQFGHDAFDQSYTNNNNFNSETSFSDIFGDVFGDIFGNNNNQNVNKGSDLKYNMELSLEEIITGVNKRINIQTLIKCNFCKGHGTRKGSLPINCLTCNGNGQIQIKRGFFTLQQTCPKCNGLGKIIKNVCNNCNGNGRIKKNKNLSIKIPKNLNTGDSIRVSGEGEAGKRGGLSGDLYIQIKIKDHYIFKRENNNLYCEIPICFSTAVLGGEIDVPTLDGFVKLKIPSETQTGKVFRIRGKGIKSLNNKFKGDLLCKVIIETPVNLNEKQKYILNNFNKSFDNNYLYKNTPKINIFNKNVEKFFKNLN